MGISRYFSDGSRHTRLNLEKGFHKIDSFRKNHSTFTFWPQKAFQMALIVSANTRGLDFLLKSSRDSYTSKSHALPSIKSHLLPYNFNDFSQFPSHLHMRKFSFCFSVFNFTSFSMCSLVCALSVYHTTNLSLVGIFSWWFCQQNVWLSQQVSYNSNEFIRF